ncbi:hypothetical protein LPJ66_000213 [Kickxella alabastrina]|uniref:Uncharacterized protein n=1 Tax=Kickxella alabastrina TaxID=61397 RepID=A0ACC1IWN5_9FUNG|nr:hypothetical protein LPJ66_000213 [Kickxella alabastrina]
MAFASSESLSSSRRFRRQSLVTYPKNMGAVVVFCSFTALALGPGLLNAYGVYEEEYSRLFDNKDEIDQSSALGSPVIFVGIIQILLANGMGFIGGQCAQRFGPGPSVFGGGILMSLGLFAASYARHVWQLCLTQGLIFGLGVCLTWIPAASAPSSWFEKNRGLATGITHMGLGIGGLVFSPLTRFLLEKAGTSGSLRWLALIILVGVTVTSLGIHSRRHLQRTNEIIMSSTRWSRCLEDEVMAMPENGYDSDENINYTDYCRSSILAHAKTRASHQPNDIGSKTGGEEINRVHNAKPISSVGSPKRVHFAPEVARQATLDKLEGQNRRQRASRQGPSIVDKMLTKLSKPNPLNDRPHSLPVLTKIDTIQPDQPEQLSLSGLPSISVMRSWRFWLLSLGVGFGQAGWYIMLLFMTSISVSVGLDVSNGAMILGAINGASAVGQFLAGYAADLIGPINALVLFTFLATLSNAILFLPHLSFHLLIVYACLCGASIGASDPLAVIAGVTQFGRARAASTTGLVYGSVGAMVLVMAPNARVLLQRLGHGSNFVPVYLLVVILFATSTFMLIVLRLRISRKLHTRI